jgi:ABC-type hemin transport system substrate-binding protein
MSYLTKMYGRNPNAVLKTSDKNPNRVAGGLRAQGVDTFTMLGEDGMEKRIPTHAYVQSLEEQIRKQRAAIDVLERKLSRQDSAIQAIEGQLRSRN